MIPRQDRGIPEVEVALLGAAWGRASENPAALECSGLLRLGGRSDSLVHLVYFFRGHLLREGLGTSARKPVAVVHNLIEVEVGFAQRIATG